MTISDPLSFEAKLDSLRERFRALLPERVEELSRLLDDDAFPDLTRRFHNLAGTAGTYGVEEIGTLAAEGEDVCENARSADPETVSYLRVLIDTMRGAAAGAPVAEDTGRLLACRSTAKARPRILCVEDDPDQASYIAAILHDAGYEVELNADRSSFEASLANFHPDLIIMDYRLPGTTGIDLARHVRENAAYTNVPIVFLTRERRMRSRIEALDVGGDDYLTKPVSPDLLRSVVSARLQRSQSVQALLDHDPLTGALTRAGFFRRVEKATSAARRRNEPLALVMIDLDHFKNVNDQHGHLAGDNVLTSVVSFLKLNLRARDEVGRYGGEEFVLLLRDITAAEAQKLVSRLIVEYGRVPPFHVTFSAGVAMWQPDSDLQSWRQRADDALYTAKHRGRARVEAA